MAEVVELRSERMIPELELLEKMQLFDKNEIRKIMKKREQFEYKLQRQTKSEEDILRYIQYDMNLLKFIKQKRAEKGIVLKNNSVDYAITNHINKLFNLAIQRFPGEVRIWLSYIKFCSQVRIYSSASATFEKMLKLHSDKPNLFKLAAQWEFEECQCIEKARKYLLEGIRLHRDSKLLYKDAFLLELNYASQKRKEITSKGEEIDPNDSVLSGKTAEVIFNTAVKQIKEVDFVLELLTASKSYDFAKSLLQKIIVYLLVNFKEEELTWDTFAKCALEGYSISETVSTAKLSLKQRIQNCVEFYEEAVKLLNTERMWTFYLDKMLELTKDATSLPNVCRSFLAKAFKGAHENNMMAEKYYIIWAEQLKMSQEKHKLYQVLVFGTEKLPGSVTLWAARLKYHLSREEEQAANRVFRAALATLADDSLPIWKLMLQYYQNINPTKTEELFNEGTAMTPGISNSLKPLYLEWLSLSRGIAAARKAYNRMTKEVPYCLEMHTKMAELEDIQPVLNLKQARKCHQFSCIQFGTTNIEVWMSYIKFEQTYGDPKMVPEIYAKAVKRLTPNLVDIFISEFSLSKTESCNSNLVFDDLCLPKFSGSETMEIS